MPAHCHMMTEDETSGLAAEPAPDNELQEALLRVGEAVLIHQRKQQEKAR